MIILLDVLRNGFLKVSIKQVIKALRPCATFDDTNISIKWDFTMILMQITLSITGKFLYLKGYKFKELSNLIL